MIVNRREVAARERDLLRALGLELRRLREDAGSSQAAIARAAGISGPHLCRIEAGTARPTVDVLLRLSAALGVDLSVRLFPNTGPRIRDRHQVAMSEALLSSLAPSWSATPEVPVYRPVRGVVDLVLEQRADLETVASEIQSQLRRIEQQLRWSAQKADAIAALPEQAGRRVTRLLVLRNTHAMREVVRAAAATMAAAYPASTEVAVASLRGNAAWPGNAVVWMDVGARSAHLLDGPPRGITVGRTRAAV